MKTSTARAIKKDWFLGILKDDFHLLGISVGLGVGVAILGMAMAIFSQKMIDEILPSREIGKLIAGILLLGFILLMRVMLNALREYLLIRQSKGFNNRIIDVFYKSLLYVPKPFFDTRKIGELVARLNDTNRIQQVIKRIAGSFIVDILTAVVSMFFLFYYSWQVGMMTIISLPVLFFDYLSL